MEAKILQFVFDSLSSNPTKKIIDNQDTDDDFLDDIFDIAEHSETIKKDFFGPRPKLSEEEFQFVQKTGELHYECAMFNKTHLMLPEQIPKQNKCKCGCNKAKGQPLPFCIDEEQATFIGPGVILFLFYNKMMFALVLMSIIIFGIYSLVTNILINNHHSNCEKPGALPFLCEVKIFTSLENKDSRDDLLLGQLILGFVMCFIWSLAIRVIRALGRRKNKMIDDYLDSSADTCILIDGLPEGDYSQKQILEFMQKKWNESQELNEFPLQIKGVQVVYKMKRVRKMISKIHDMSRELVKIVSIQRDQFGAKKYIIKQDQMDQYKFKKEQILLMYNKLKNFRDKFWDDAQFRYWLSAGMALVEFQQTGQQQRFLEVYGESKKTALKQIIKSVKAKYFTKITSKFQGENIRMIKAPQPSDIFWDHCEEKVKKRRVFFVWVINILLMSCSFGAQMIVRQIKIEHPEISELGIISIFTLNFFNRIVWNLLLYFIFIEKNHTKTDNIISAMNKSYISQVMNIILIPIILNLVLANKLDGPSGLAGAIHDYQITAFFFMMIFNFINFPHLILKIIRSIKCLRRAAITFYCRVTGELDTYDEMKDALFFLYTPPNPPLAGLYVYITTVISQAAFFCHLMPVILLYLLASILLFYMINRYIILKRCKIPDLIDFVVFETCCGFAMNVPLLYAIGSLLFLKLRDGPPSEWYYLPSLLCIVVWLLSTQSPFGLYQKMTDCVLNTCFSEEKPTKEEANVGLDLISRVLNAAKIDAQSKKKKQRTVTKRLQNYHANCTTTLIFNMQNQLKEVAGRYHNRSKQFCHRFTLNMNDQQNKKEKAELVDDFDEEVLSGSSNNLIDESESGSKIMLKKSKKKKMKSTSPVSIDDIKVSAENERKQKVEKEKEEEQFDRSQVFRNHEVVFSGFFGQFAKNIEEKN